MHSLLRHQTLCKSNSSPNDYNFASNDSSLDLLIHERSLILLKPYTALTSLAYMINKILLPYTPFNPHCYIKFAHLKESLQPNLRTRKQNLPATISIHHKGPLTISSIHKKCLVLEIKMELLAGPTICQWMNL
jgi:hypothetical protein